MVAILIFALGILGLVAMGGTAVSSQSDAQYRTEASSLADAIAGEIAVGIDRTSEATKAATAGRLRPPAEPAPRRCRRRACSPAQRSIASAARRGGADRPCRERTAGVPVCPGATLANQQIFIDGAGTFNRVVITLCWKTASDTVCGAGTRSSPTSIETRHERPAPCSAPASPSSRGFTLVEILVGVAIGLIGLVAIFQAIAIWSKHTATTTSGGDAQVAGTLALFNIERDVKRLVTASVAHLRDHGLRRRRLPTPLPHGCSTPTCAGEITASAGGAPRPDRASSTATPRSTSKRRLHRCHASTKTAASARRLQARRLGRDRAYNPGALPATAQCQLLQITATPIPTVAPSTTRRRPSPTSTRRPRRPRLPLQQRDRAWRWPERCSTSARSAPECLVDPEQPSGSPGPT